MRVNRPLEVRRLFAYLRSSACLFSLPFAAAILQGYFHNLTSRARQRQPCPSSLARMRGLRFVGLSLRDAGGMSLPLVHSWAAQEARKNEERAESNTCMKYPDKAAVFSSGCARDAAGCCTCLLSLDRLILSVGSEDGSSFSCELLVCSHA